MSKDTIDTRQDAEYDYIINKSMDLHDSRICEYYTGTTPTSKVFFDFTNYSGACLTVKPNYRANQVILVFDTLDGSIVLGVSGGTFQLNKTSTELSTLPIGEFQYNMWLRNSVESHRSFLSGKFIIEAVIL